MIFDRKNKLEKFHARVRSRILDLGTRSRYIFRRIYRFEFIGRVGGEFLTATFEHSIFRKLRKRAGALVQACEIARKSAQR